ncbi:MAG: 16S rRNA (guanine(527)-N(7))-methyltransferase RsmG [Kofleriaceae bacterium]
MLDSKFEAFMALFEKWNKSINLSAARTRDELAHHIADCLHIVPHLASAKTVLDVGSGGGLPVVIAALSLPDVEFTALEPVHKKHAFLRTAARELELANLEAFATRIEDHDRRDYDVASSRATFDLGEWLSLGLTYVRPGGFVVGFEAVERNDLPTPIERHSYELDDKTRAIVIARRST